ncbi:hypothetical protein [Methylorubrum extorquens]|uniref:hypothetical protein n=1 Tax=Methylorubrum extorquens TaxID=408 RepID=UPI0012DB7624|nr:hypothetical protein [Methylorubrum extorquens]
MTSPARNLRQINIFWMVWAENRRLYQYNQQDRQSRNGIGRLALISLCFERVSERDESAPCSRFDRAEPWDEMGAGQRDEPEGAADD